MLLGVQWLFDIRHCSFWTIGVYAASPCFAAWVPNNSAWQARQTTAIAMAFICTNVGGIISTWIYPTSSAPYYTSGAAVNCGACVPILSTACQLLWLRRLNQNTHLNTDSTLASVSALPEDEQFANLGDHHPDFKYTY